MEWDVNAMKNFEWCVNTYDREDIAERRERDEDIKGAFCRRAIDVAEEQRSDKSAGARNLLLRCSS